VYNPNCNKGTCLSLEHFCLFISERLLCALSVHTREREREKKQLLSSFSRSLLRFSRRRRAQKRASSFVYILLSDFTGKMMMGRGPAASITNARANERSGLLETPNNAAKEEEETTVKHRNASSLLKKIAKARTKVNVPSAIGGFAVGVKFGFVLLLVVLVCLPRERFDSLRTNLGEFLPISLSERVVAPESSYKREHGVVANLGAAKPLAGDWNPNGKSEKREVKYPRKDLTPKPTKVAIAKKKKEEEEKIKKTTTSKSSSKSSSSSKKNDSSSSSSKHSLSSESSWKEGKRSREYEEKERQSSSKMGEREERKEEGKDDEDNHHHRNKNDWYNGPEPIPHLIDHLEAHDLKPSDKDLRILTIANAAYWPLAEIMLDSAKRHAPEIANRLTFILSDEKSVKQCKDRVTKSCQHTCFFDHEMEDMLGKYTNDEGSYKSAYDSNFGVKLRQLWTWRKVKAVKTLVDAGYAAMFVDASTVFLRDMREDVLHELLDHDAALVTLSDFGGATEQHATNTGLIAATPANKDAARVLRTWLKREDPEDKDNTEQGVLTWEIAPKERENGVIIKALTQVQAPNYVTYDFKSHLNKGNDDGGKLGKDEKGKSEEKQQHVAGLVHAAYCGCVDAKESFMSRVYEESKMSSKELGERGLKPEKIEEKDCDVYDRKKFLNTGRAPWD
jgi:hypothetical protein